ncbi:MAG: hypothetical protein KKD39_00630 [Candidatus Altiarchaeota archaeon]|nr:hypothetical protein [Candidatus Altiarchaeota archaeon]
MRERQKNKLLTDVSGTICEGFLRPTKWKIYLALLLPYITYTVHYTRALPFEKGIWYGLLFEPVPLILLVGFYIYSYFSGAVSSYPIFSKNEQILHFSMDYILPFLINYAIACLLVTLYKRLRNL